MKRLIVLVLAAIVMPIGALKAVDCDWIADVDNTAGCSCCSCGLCYGTGSIQISYDCPDPEGDCPQGEYCDFGSSGSDEELTYAEPDCWHTFPCPSDYDCIIEGWDQESIVISRIGECYCK